MRIHATIAAVTLRAFATTTLVACASTSPSPSNAPSDTVDTSASSSSASGDALPALDRRRVAEALGKAEMNIQGCGHLPDDYIGHVVVTFVSSGEVSSVVVDADFPGSDDVKACITREFERAHVPPFRDPQVKVGKSFHLR